LRIFFHYSFPKHFETNLSHPETDVLPPIPNMGNVKRRFTMKRKILMPLLFVLVALPAAAQDFGSVFGQPMPLVAQMSQEERRDLRERWEHAGPEERARLRKAFQERLRMPSPEQFDPRHMDFRQGRGTSRERADTWGNFMPGNGFGTGYEQRRFEGRYPYEDEPGNGSSDYGNSGGGDRRGGGRR
jgi:hypothetical protein